MDRQYFRVSPAHRDTMRAVCATLKDARDAAEIAMDRAGFKLRRQEAINSATKLRNPEALGDVGIARLRELVRISTQSFSINKVTNTLRNLDEALQAWAKREASGEPHVYASIARNNGWPTWDDATAKSNPTQLVELLANYMDEAKLVDDGTFPSIDGWRTLRDSVDKKFPIDMALLHELVLAIRGLWDKSRTEMRRKVLRLEMSARQALDQERAMHLDDTPRVRAAQLRRIETHVESLKDVAYGMAYATQIPNQKKAAKKMWHLYRKLSDADAQLLPHFEPYREGTSRFRWLGAQSAVWFEALQNASRLVSEMRNVLKPLTQKPGANGQIARRKYTRYDSRNVVFMVKNKQWQGPF